MLSSGVETKEWTNIVRNHNEKRHDARILVEGKEDKGSFFTGELQFSEKGGGSHE